jgi:alcohol dehydrogenase (NADP+)
VKSETLKFKNSFDCDKLLLQSIYQMAAMTFLNLPGGVKMPALGIGTFDAISEADVTTSLNAAFEAGYRHVDTAHVYQNEKNIGKVLKQWFASGKLKREDLFITTKLPMYGVHPDRVEFFMKTSLENLQLDYVDLYLVHFPAGTKFDESTRKQKVNEKKEPVFEGKTDQAAVWKKMEEQVDAGRAKTIGLSNYNISQIETVLKSARIKPSTLQIEIHVFLQQNALIDFCHKNGIAVVAYSPLCSRGFNKFLKRIGKPETKLPDILADPVISKIAKKHSKTSAQIALRFLIQRGVAAIPKSATPKRVQENINVFDFTLDDKDLKELRSLDVGERARVCDWKLFDGIEKHQDYPFQTV